MVKIISYAAFVAHGGNQHGPAELDLEFTQAVADTMQALSTPSRLRSSASSTLARRR